MAVAILSGVTLRVQIAPGVDRTDPVSSWPWVDITGDVRVDEGITIQVGRPDESGQVDPGSCSLTLDNSTGNYSRTNPVGTYYPDLTKNTPLRVQVDIGSGYVTRFIGDVVGWPPRWDKSGNLATAMITAAGILRRLGQRSKPLRSVAYRTITAVDNTGDLIAYWPMEDQAGATSVSSPTAGVKAGLVSGEVTFGGDTASASSEQMITFGTAGQIEFTVPTYVSTEHKVIFLARVPQPELTTGSIIARLTCTGGTIATIDLVYTTPTIMTLKFYTGAAVEVEALGPVDWSNFIGSEREFFNSLEFTQNGANIDVLHLLLRLSDGVTGTPTDTVVGQTLGRIESITFGVSDCSGMSIGQLAVANSTSAFPNYISPVNGVLGTQGFAGEHAADRIERLCDENDVPVSIVGTASESETMGPQPVTDLLGLLREGEETDGGVLYEDAAGLAYQVHADRRNATAALELDADAGDLAEAPEPADDDQRLVNDMTVDRVDGSSARYEAVGDYAPDGPVGRYDEQLTINVETDDALQFHAEWRVHLGTVDELRWPVLDLNLAHSTGQRADWLTCMVGSRVTVDNPPAVASSTALDLFVEGYAEQFGWRIWRASLNCSPARPWVIAVIEGAGPPAAPPWVLTSAESTLSAGISSSATSLSVATTTAPLWTTSEVPLDVEIGGEQITVSAISGASSPQTFTVSARSVNGVTKAHLSGATVKLWRPPVLARN